MFRNTHPGGFEEDLNRLEMEFHEKDDIASEIGGPRLKDKMQVKVSNSVITFDDRGLIFEPDPMHAEWVMEFLCLLDAKPVLTPSVTE